MTISQRLVDELKGAILSIVPEDKVGIAFSGGVDSSLLAMLCANLGKEITLLTIGFPGSHDLSFSSEIALKMGLNHKTLEISITDFENDIVAVQLLIGCSNTSHIENCIAYRSIARLAKQNGTTIILSANGFDELFCGYNAYRAVYEKGPAAVVDFMNEKVENELELISEISTSVSEYGVAVRQPFLSSKFVEFARSIPLEHKIKGSNDTLRKHMLREVAIGLGVPEASAMKPKKALQYGSNVHRNYKRFAKSHMH